jgi:hypothetical protein
MKQYVLDEPGARPPGGASQAPAAASSRWRWPIVLAGTAAVALVAAHSFVGGHPEPKPLALETAFVPTYVAPTASEAPRPVAAAAPAVAPVEAAPSRVTHEKGRYVVDLHAAAIGPALSMLSEATHATVTGGDVVAASPARITASFVAASPLEAWRGVFGDIASFAMTCGQSSCAVRFVSLVGERAFSLSSTPLNPPQPASPAPAGAPESSESSEAPNN